jgi:hypothetical protein
LGHYYKCASFCMNYVYVCTEYQYICWWSGLPVLQTDVKSVYCQYSIGMLFEVFSLNFSCRYVSSLNALFLVKEIEQQKCNIIN